MNIVKSKPFVVRLEADKAIQNLFAFLFAKDLIQIMLNMVIPLGITRTLIYSIELILILIAWRRIQFTITKTNLLFFFFWTIYLFFSALLLKSERGMYIILILNNVIPCLPLYFIGKLVPKQDARIITSMRLVPAATAFSYVMYYMMSQGYGNIAYSQWLGYALLPSCCIAFGLFINSDFFQAPFMVILLWGVLASGARGPLVCVIFAVVLFILGKADLRSFKWWGLILICTSLGVGVYSYYKELLYFLIQMFNEMNISTRTLNALLTNSFIESSGRNALIGGVWKGIRSNPFGLGIFRDRQFLRPYLRDAMTSEGTYAHNFFLECFLQYGVIFGSVIIVVFIWLMVRCFINVKNNKEQFLCFVVLVASGFFPLLVSGSYLQWENFYMLMGYFAASRLAKSEAGKKQ